MVWERNEIQCLQSQDLSWFVASGNHFAAGGPLKVLSRDEEDGSETALARLTGRHVGRLDGPMDVYVLKGRGTLNETEFGPNHYAFLPAGSFVDLIPAPPSVVVLLASFGPPTLAPSKRGAREPAATLVDVDAVPWSEPEWSGGEPVGQGALVKWLRQHDQHGVMYFSAKLPGWRHEVEECHPHAEESFRLYGESMLGTCVLGPGAYFYRNPGDWHGPQFTATGTTSLIRAEVKTITEFRPISPAYDFLQARQRTFDQLSHPALSDWQTGR